MYKCKLLTFTLLAVAAIVMFTGCATTADNHPVERAVEQPIKDAASAVQEDYKRADEENEDIVDKAFAPLDDTMDTINRDLNREPGDSGDTPPGNNE